MGVDTDNYQISKNIESAKNGNLNHKNFMMSILKNADQYIYII